MSEPKDRRPATEHAWWMLGHPVTMEAVSSAWQPPSGTVRWPVHADGRIGSPSVALMLAVGHGNDRAVVGTIVSSAAGAFSDWAMYAQRLVDVLPPATGRQGAEPTGPRQRWSEEESWRLHSIRVDDRDEPCWRIDITTAVSATILQQPDRVVAMASSIQSGAVLGIRTVFDWAPSRIDLSRPHPATAWRDRAAEVRTMW